jgi:multidrug efflux pump subunit AcrA (membrane-fusion protein)
VKHGARVKKGEVLVTFDTEKLDRTIDDLRADLKLAELSLQQSEEQLRAMEKTTPMDLEGNERAARTTEEDRRYYFDKQRPYQLKLAEHQLKSAKNMLEYQQEELRQLEKMYKADDVTEETEEIVLKRARDQVETAKMYVESAQMRHDYTVQFNTPREDERVKDVSQRNRLEIDKARIVLPISLQRQRLEIEKLRVARLRSDERLKKLLADRELMTVKSPGEGVVYYGKCTRGKFSDAGVIAEMLRRNGIVQPNQVFLTVVQPQALTIRAAVAEDQVHRLRPGVAGTAVPTAYPSLKLPVTLSRIGDIPISTGSFDAQVKVTLDKDARSVMPGMGCRVKLVSYLKKDALTVPAKALMTDEVDDHTFVYVQAKDGKTSKCPVTVGQKTDRQAEIVKGLAEGEQVLLEAPKEK